MLTETSRQWAEVCFVPNAIGHSKRGPEYRYLAIREPMQDQLTLPGMEQVEKALPFQTVRKGGVRYKVFGIVTNMHWEGQELIEWHYKRCGRSEQAHSVMKEDLAGGTLPSGDFGDIATWAERWDPRSSFPSKIEGLDAAIENSINTLGKDAAVSCQEEPWFFHGLEAKKGLYASASVTV